ncbi:MAG: O-sialoglycoprotein endopeptidase, partial [uncultured bacterium]
MKIFAIESSCDETAAALVEDGTRDIAGVVASSKELHEQTGGIVPEVAARKQVEFIVPVIEQTLVKAQKALGLACREDVIASIDSLAVTVGPGLIGSLVVGVEAAKALAV